MAQSTQEWLAAYAAELGIAPPDDVELDQLLRLAGIAARASERRAAPITCWLAGRAAVTSGDALAAGERLAAAGDDDAR